MLLLPLPSPSLCAICVCVLVVFVQSVIRYLAAVTSSNWTKKARGSSKAGAPPAGDSSNNNGSGGSGDADAAGVLRQWLLSSRGKGLLELIEALGGKPVSLKVSLT